MYYLSQFIKPQVSPRDYNNEHEWMGRGDGKKRDAMVEGVPIVPSASTPAQPGQPEQRRLRRVFGNLVPEQPERFAKEHGHQVSNLTTARPKSGQTLDRSVLAPETQPVRIRGMRGSE